MDKQTLSNRITDTNNRSADTVIRNAKIVNVYTGEILPGDVGIRCGMILGIGSYDADNVIDAGGAYLTPGLINAHMHIESSMAHPDRFARAVLPKGTTTVLADAHEIANVKGADGIRYMLEQTEDLPLSVLMMLPSCVPCTAFETAGAALTAKDMSQFLSHPRVIGLGEVMDTYAVTNCDEGMLDKLLLFEGQPVDGHAPLLSGDRLNAYRVAGPYTDHECSSFEEVMEKLRIGMYVHLRLGSACRDIEGIMRSIAENRIPARRFLLCTDDKHLEDIRTEGEINYILRRAVANGISPLEALQMATLNAAEAYGLKDRGAIAPGLRADLVLFEDLTDFEPLMVMTGGSVYSPQEEKLILPDPKVYDSVRLAPRPEGFLDLPVSGPQHVIELSENSLLTTDLYGDVPTENGLFTARDGFLKMVVLERHHATGRCGLGIMKGLGLHNGAIASTVAHDSHNLLCAGDNDADMQLAINTLEKCGGGFVVASRGDVLSCLPLPIAGLMSDLPLEDILRKQQELLAAARKIGAASGSDPFIRLSFTALPVIPSIRITDMGMFNAEKMEFFQK